MPLSIPRAGKIKLFNMLKFIKRQIKDEHSAWGNIGQWGGVLLITIGFFIEVQLKGDIRIMILTAGCLIFTLSTKLKHEKRK